MSVEKENLQKYIFNKVNDIYVNFNSDDYKDLISIKVISILKDSIVYNVTIKKVADFITSSLDGIWGITEHYTSNLQGEDILIKFKRHLNLIYREIKIKSILKQ